VNYVSPVFSRLTGIETHRLVGLGEQECSDLLCRACSGVGCFGGIAGLRALAAESGGEVRKRLEFVNGGRRVIEIALRANGEGSVSQILCLRDVTLESQVEDMKSEFLSTAAHELRTPMTSILGFTEVLMSQSLTEEHRSELQGIIYRQSELMASILNELLDLARIEARRGKDFVFRPTHVQGLLAQVLQAFKVPAGRAAPSLEMPDLPLYVVADPGKLTQVLVNVLSNAYKYSPAGGEVSLTLLDSVDTRSNARMIGVQTTDQGIGMTAEQVERIFERFYRADTSGKVLGTGLGMSIVYEIVSLHGGRVDVHSTPGGGTTVTFWIPVALEAIPH
jgi:signal transduction histidine kinase